MQASLLKLKDKLLLHRKLHVTCSALEQYLGKSTYLSKIAEQNGKVASILMLFVRH